MRRLRQFEDVLVRVESALAVVLVVVMLTLAGYNVVYRNILVRLQNHWAHSGPPVEKPAPATAGAAADAGAKTEPAKAEPEKSEPAKTEPEKAEPAKAEPAKAEGGDDFGGFGGGFGDEDEAAKAEPAKAEPTKAEPAKPEGSDDFGGFGGGFDGGDGSEPADGGGGEDFGGFGGEASKAGADAPAVDAAEVTDEDLEDIFGEASGGEDQFANLPTIDAVAAEAEQGPQGGPPPEGSFAAWGVKLVDQLKLEWIDVLLRQLVIIVAFFGAALATPRRKHINIDALSKILPPAARRVVPIMLHLVSVSVCVLLASAGWDLVQISSQYPKDLVPFAEESTFQLMFPLGFGLLAVHFGIRLVESIVDPPDDETRPPTGVHAAVPSDDAADREEVR